MYDQLYIYYYVLIIVWGAICLHVNNNNNFFLLDLDIVYLWRITFECEWKCCLGWTYQLVYYISRTQDAIFTSLPNSCLDTLQVHDR